MSMDDVPLSELEIWGKRIAALEAELAQAKAENVRLRKEAQELRVIIWPEQCESLEGRMKKVSIELTHDELDYMLLLLKRVFDVEVDLSEKLGIEEAIIVCEEQAEEQGWAYANNND